MNDFNNRTRMVKLPTVIIYKNNNFTATLQIPENKGLKIELDFPELKY